MTRFNKALLSSQSRHPFNAFSKWTSYITGHPYTFVFALLIIATWALSGQYFEYSNTWQLVINTGTTIVTFLMVFLIQNTQNRESQAVQIKLDEIIRVDKEAHNALLDLEELTEKELLAIKSRYEKLAQEARKQLRKGKKDKGSPEI